ncbi:hypothetical protein [Acinetobacter sp. A47]|uniref:hypothetical protein n=1 Tax=Acinetobacter sp. A47 TaxID=1561217 RepID=UPI00056F730D|nr:hypothetical protein [Acinetobacter sp. A47]
MIKAHQFTGTLNSSYALTSWIIDGTYIYPSNVLGEGKLEYMILPLPEGNMRLNVGDWLVQRDGGFKSYTDTEFRANYLPANVVLKALDNVDALKELLP